MLKQLCVPISYHVLSPNVQQLQNNYLSFGENAKCVHFVVFLGFAKVKQIL